MFYYRIHFVEHLKQTLINLIYECLQIKTNNYLYNGLQTIYKLEQVTTLHVS